MKYSYLMSKFSNRMRAEPVGDLSLEPEIMFKMLDETDLH